MATESRESVLQQKQIRRLRDSNNAKQQQLASLKYEIDEAQNTKPPSKKLKHKLTPLSKEVHGDEYHFRLAQNRVAYVPITELIDRLSPQIERRKDWLVKYRRHQGSIGPIEGFTMNYVVERQPLSLADELVAGRGMIRIGVSRWQVDPTAGLRSESADEALQTGSEFAQRLMEAPLKTTLTFWVYADSFSLFRRLQKFAYDEGFRVAARPLPMGVAIAGSPNGSRSSGQ